MLKIGEYNTLTVGREVDFGYYLTCDDGREILIPRKYVPENTVPGDEIRVFVYTDSEDRLIATTEHPFATVGQFAYLQVNDVNDTGAFLDWGISGKELLVPYSQQRSLMHRGGIYLVYVYLDDATKRVVASAKTDKFLGNVIPRYKAGDEVSCLVTEHTPIGFKVIVDNLHRGMIYENELYKSLEIQQTVTAYVKHVREDGKIDLTMSDKAQKRVGSLSDQVLEAIRQAGGTISLTDESTPEEIRAAFACSKRDYKKALGHLYKEGLVLLGKGEVTLSTSGKIAE